MDNFSTLADLFYQTKRKVFVSYHHDNDQQYKDAFINAFSQNYEVLTDNSLTRAFDSDNPEYVSRRIRESHVTGSSCTIVLCGEETRWRKYIDWEIKATLDKVHGLIGINLPTNPRDVVGRVQKPDRLQDNINSGYAVWIDWANFVASLNSVKSTIELALSKPNSLIVNNRAMRQRNG